MKISSKNENVDLWKIAPKLDYINLREKYINEKIFKTGTIVESLNTGLSGKVIRRGTNYLICVTEDDVMFKSWIKDVTEVHEAENPSKNLRQLVQKAKKRQDNNIDGFSNNEDQKVGPYGAFIPQARNFGTNFKKLRSESKRFTDVSGVPADQREVGTDSLRKYAMKMAQVKNIQNFINKYKKNKVST